MRSSDRFVLAATVAVLLISVTARPLTSDSSYLGQTWFLVLALAGVTVGLRRARLTAGFVLAAQIVVLAVLLFVFASVTPSRGEPWFAQYVDLWQQGIQHMQTQAAPMEPDAGVKIIFVSVIGVIFVLTDLLVSGLDRPAWGIVPPAAAFVVPALGLGIDTGVAPFLCLAVGYLGILIADGLNRTGRWTRGLSRDSADGFGTAMPVVWRAAGLIGAPALIATLVLGVALPTLALPGLGIGAGGSGGGPLQLTDPTIDLRRNLNQPDDAVVIRYTTDRPGGLYLRMASLPEIDASGWSNVEMRLDSGTTMPPIPGVDGDGGDRRSTQISVLDFGSMYLPLPYAPREVDVAGPWAHDPTSLVMLSSARGDQDDAIRNLDYTVLSTDTDPDPQALARAVAGTPVDSKVTDVLPPNLPESIKELTREVTRGSGTDAEKAWAIQEFLRDTSRFTYSTEPLPGNGYRALENFLLRDHRGYCEQFAAAMAMMAREVGIPSRVAVGFLPGKRVEDKTWEVSIRDMHAWPELYFAGYGWVRFEPTPASVTGTAPVWTVPQAESSNGDETLAPSRGTVGRRIRAVRSSLGRALGRTDRRRDRIGLRLAADSDRERCRAAGAAHPGRSGDHPLPPPIITADGRGRAGGSGRGSLGRAARHGDRLRRKLAGGLAALDRIHGRAASGGAGVRGAGAGGGAGRTGPLRSLDRRRRSGRPAAGDPADPSRPGPRLPLATPAGVRAAEVAVHPDEGLSGSRLARSPAALLGGRAHARGPNPVPDPLVLGVRRLRTRPSRDPIDRSLGFGGSARSLGRLSVRSSRPGLDVQQPPGADAHRRLQERRVLSRSQKPDSSRRRRQRSSILSMKVPSDDEPCGARGRSPPLCGAIVPTCCQE